MAAHTVSLKEALTPSQSTAMFEKDGRGYSIDSEAQTSHNGTTLALKRRRTISLMSASIGALTIIYLGLIYCLPDSWDPLWANGASSDLVYSSVIAESEDASQDYYQSDLKGTTSYDDDPTSILVPQFSTEEPTKLLMPITTRQPYDVLTAFYVNGTVPHSEDITHKTIDMVYLWVNSSSPILQDDMAIRAASEGVSIGQGKDQRFRDNGELRGAMRSAAKSFGDDLRKIHVLTGDYAFDIEEYRHLLPEAAQEDLERDVEDDIVEGWTIGQVPNWLDWSNVGFTSSNQTLSSKVDWHFHSSVFRQPRDHLLETVDLEQRKQNVAQEREWRDESLPNFDSFAIESRVGWLEGLSDNYVLANDDMFMLSDMTAADFHHPLLGAVTRFDPTFTVRPLVDISLQSTEGEWGGLQYAASLIAKRFPSKVRGYLHHMPKAMTKATTQEATVMWEEEMNEAATRGFRASARGIADIEMSWLTSWLQIERWREAMLWSFTVGRVGGADGVWGPDSRDAMRSVLGNVDSRGMVLIKGGKRSTLQTVANTMPLADQPKGTRYGFSSMDGHVPPRPDQPDISPNCLFSIDRCLSTGFFANPSQSHSAAAMFERMTFEYPECGDCLIKALISASGDRGMEAVLPTADQVYYPKQQAPVRWQREEPMLPLVSSWRQGDFSMANVVKVGQDVWEGKVGRSDGGVDLRDWCIKLLSRYAYVWATSHTHFALIQNLGQLTNAFYHLDMNKKLSMGCLNDNQPDGGAAGVPEAFGDWMSERWGDVDATWERPGVEWPRSPVEELDEVDEDNEDTPGSEEVEDLEDKEE